MLLLITVVTLHDYAIDIIAGAPLLIHDAEGAMSLIIVAVAKRHIALLLMVEIIVGDMADAIRLFRAAAIGWSDGYYARMILP